MRSRRTSSEAHSKIMLILNALPYNTKLAGEQTVLQKYIIVHFTPS